MQDKASIALREVTTYRPETQTNKLKLTLANASLETFVINKMRKMAKLR